MLRPIAFATSCCCLISAACLGFACTPEPEPVTYDPAEVHAQAANFETEFERIDNGTFASAHMDEMALARIWANEEAAEVFRSIDPNDLDATAEYPRGSILVKENLDMEGSPLALTVLAKFEEGYNDKANDWHFAMIDYEGNVLMDTAGTGAAVESCRDCHSQMGANTDHTIGLPPDQLR